MTTMALYDIAESELGELFGDFVIQSYDSHSSGKLAGKITDAGRAKARAAAKPKAPPEMSETESLEGEKNYTRPNGDLYYSRNWGDHNDVQVLIRARELSQYPLLYGAPGCGKTALVEAAFGDDLYTVLGSGDTEVADLVGGYVQTPTGAFVWEDGPLIKAAENGKPLLIDEIGLIDTKVLSIVYGLMDGRREYTVTANPERGTVKAKEGFYVVAATNPNAPGVRLSEALLSRFALHVEVTTDWGLARKLGCPTPMVTAAQNLAKKQNAAETSWAPQMRELLAFRDIDKEFGTKFAIANLLAAAPEFDRPVVADVLSRVYGETCLPAKI
jgi:nitric oxide reductase NorQ protein